MPHVPPVLGAPARRLIEAAAGDRLFIAAKTVEHHMARMRQRLGCAGRAGLLARLRVLTAVEDSP